MIIRIGKPILQTTKKTNKKTNKRKDEKKKTKKKEDPDKNLVHVVGSENIHIN